MERAVALLGGLIAWAAVAVIAVAVVNAWSDENQILAFIPIAVAVVVAWAIGEVVTERVFARHEEANDGIV